jgi:hypothetical protein
MIKNTLKIQIIVIAYNRFKHTKEVLDSLQKENVENIKLYLDGPLTDKDKEEQIKIKNSLSKYSYKVELIERATNTGLAKSITGAVTDNLKENDAIILLEDDCVPLHGFINYMEVMLETYKNNKKIGSICGYLYPHINITNKDNEIFFINRFCPWGWATWSDRWEGFSLDLKTQMNEVLDKNLNIKDLGTDVYNYCTNEHFINNEMDIWSLNWILKQFINNMFVIYPKTSLIKNIGFDGTGIHSSITKVFDIEDNLYYCVLDFSLYGFKKSDLLYCDKYKQKEIIRFLEQNSKMTYLLQN